MSVPSHWSADSRAAADPVAPHGTAPSLRHRFTHAAIWTVAGAVLSRAMALLGSVAAARILGPAQFGALGAIQGTTALFGIFAGLGLGVTATRFVSEARVRSLDRVGPLAALTLALSTLGGCVCVILLGAAAGPIADRALRARELTSSLRISSIVVLFATVAGVQTGLVAGLEGFRRGAWASTVRGLLAAGALAAGAWLGGLRGAVLGLIAGEVVGVILLHAVLSNEFRHVGVRLRWDFDAEEWSRIWRFGLAAFTGSVSVMPALWAAKVLLVRSPGGLAAAGAFDAAQRISQLITFLPSALTPMQLPLLASLHAAGDARGYRRVLRANTLLALAVCLPAALPVAAAAPIVMRVYGSGYADGWPALSLLSLGAVPLALNSALGQAAVSRGAVWVRAASDVALAVLMVLAAVLLVPPFGPAGLAAAHAIAYAGAAALVAAWLVRQRAAGR